MNKIILLMFVCVFSISVNAQSKPTPVTDPEAGALLEKAAAKYSSSKALDIDFTLTTVNPKLKPEDDDSKYTTNDNGRLYMKDKAFKLVMNDNEIYCDGKTIWTFIAKNNEAQVNDYEESKETFSPTRIFTMYKEGYSYQIKEKKTFQGKNVTVIELSPTDRKSTFFKIDIGIEDGTGALMESKVYEKSGVRYIYKINKVNPAAALNQSNFVFDAKQHPNVKLTDLR